MSRLIDTQILLGSQPNNQPAKQPNNQTAKQPNSQTAKQPNNQPAKQPNNQTAKQPTNQTTKQPHNQTVIRIAGTVGIVIKKCRFNNKVSQFRFSVILNSYTLPRLSINEFFV